MPDPSPAQILDLVRACEEAGLTTEEMIAVIRAKLSTLNHIYFVEREGPPPVLIPNPFRWAA